MRNPRAKPHLQPYTCLPYITHPRSEGQHALGLCSGRHVQMWEWITRRDLLVIEGYRGDWARVASHLPGSSQVKQSLSRCSTTPPHP